MKILVTVDGSEPALDAVRHALSLRREGLQAGFVLATVQEPTYVYEMILAPDAGVLERMSGTVGARAGKRRSAFQCRRMSLRARDRLRRSGADAARDRSALRVCTHHHGGARSGCVAQRVARLGVARGFAFVTVAGHDRQAYRHRVRGWRNRCRTRRLIQIDPDCRSNKTCSAKRTSPPWHYRKRNSATKPFE